MHKWLLMPTKLKRSALNVYIQNLMLKRFYWVFPLAGSSFPLCSILFVCVILLPYPGDSNAFKIVKMIMERNLAPVIVFSFSRKDCEGYAMQMNKLDFTSGTQWYTPSPLMNLFDVNLNLFFKIYLIINQIIRTWNFQTMRM